MRKAHIVFLVIIGGFFAFLLVSEWYFRFARYHFEMQLLHLPERPLQAQENTGKRTGQAFSTNLLAETRGGDLTALIGIARAAEPFAEIHPGGTVVKDEHGFVNQPHDPSRARDVVIVGDSFMATGRSEDIFAAKLEGISGFSVYNRALIGHGPFVSVEKYLDDERFKARPPRFLVWGFAERELHGKFFDRLYHNISGLADSTGSNVTVEINHGRKPLIVHWHSLAPERLRQSLPASSILAQTSQWIWNRLRYPLFGKIHPDLVPSATPVVDGSMLFYIYHIESIRTPPGQRDTPAILRAVKLLDETVRKRGTQLVVMLIPEKEQVYRDAIPSRYNPVADPIPPSVLGEVEQGLHDMNVPVVNLLGEFRSAYAAGTRLYWRDDTHWKPEGAEVAARQVWTLISTMTNTSRARIPAGDPAGSR